MVAEANATVSPEDAVAESVSGDADSEALDSAAKLIVCVPCAIVSWNVLPDVCALGLVASVTVTVNVVAASALPGVPVSCPVAVSKASPLGSVPPDSAKP